MVILNLIVRHMQAKSWAAYRALRRVHYAGCITQGASRSVHYRNL